MADRDDLASRLEALGAAETPQLSDERRSVIEARVLAATSTGEAAGGRRRFAMALAGAAVLALLFIGAIVVLGGRGSTTDLDAVSGTVAVELPDGRVLDGVVGTDLPDGAVIDIADGGSATVDGVALPPGRYALVDGRPEPLPTSSTSTTTTMPGTTTTTSPSAPAQDDAVAPSRTTTTTLAVRPTTTLADRPPVRPTTTVSVRPIDRPTTTTSTSPPVIVDRPTSTAPRTTSTTLEQRPTTTTTIPGDRSRDR